MDPISRAFLEFKATPESKIFPSAAFGYWKVTVERPLRLHGQLSLKAIETLRFASGDEEMRAALYDEFGEDLFGSLDQVATALEKRLAEWGDEGEGQGGDVDDAEDRAGARKGLPEKRRKKLLDPKTWERDGRLVDVAMALREALGDALFEDHNVFRDRVDAALKKSGAKLPVAEMTLILKAVSWRAETLPPVIDKVHKPGKLTGDPMLGLYGAVVAGKACVAEYEHDVDLRDTEQVPLLEVGGIEAFARREVLPYVPDAWVSNEATKIGYEVSFTCHFYKPQPLRTLAEISADILAVEIEADGLLDGWLHLVDPDGPVCRVDDQRADSCDAVANIELEPLRRTASDQGPVGPGLLRRDVPHRTLGRSRAAAEGRRHAVPAHRPVEATNVRDLGGDQQVARRADEPRHRVPRSLPAGSVGPQGGLQRA